MRNMVSSLVFGCFNLTYPALVRLSHATPRLSSLSYVTLTSIDDGPRGLHRRSTCKYCEWYLAAQLDLDDAVGSSNKPILQRLKSVRRGKKVTKSSGEKSLQSASHRWRVAMNAMSPYDRVQQVALYLLCWGEAAQVRFCPECLCFIFECADDYNQSPECQNRIEPVPKGLYLRAIIEPMYRFIRDQGYGNRRGTTIDHWLW
jgi:hypothetical protein